MTQPIEQFLEINGAALWTVAQGAGAPMLLLNGGFGLCDYLGDVATLIEDRVRVHRFEPRGCGRSSLEGPFDFEHMIADIEALRVAFDLEHWIIGGHSAGADLALAYALTRFPFNCFNNSLVTNKTKSAPAPDPHPRSTARTAHTTPPPTPREFPCNDLSPSHHSKPITARLVATS